MSARSGVSVAVLRAWEQRFGFPQPQRLAGGHRRYADDDVARVQRVVSERGAGRSLESAIEVARRSAPVEAGGEADRSIFASLRRARPDLSSQVIGRRSMLALSRAVEEECCAHADRPHLVAAFQTEAAYAANRRRWDDLLDTASTAVIFADFPRSARRDGHLHVAIPPHDPLRREWSLVCDAPASAAVLAGWERADGRFEAIWSVDASVVRQAAELGWRLAEEHAPRFSMPSPDREPLPSHDASALRRASAIANRALAHLDP